MDRGVFQESKTSDKLKTKQYAVSAGIWGVLFLILQVVRWRFGSIAFGAGQDSVPVDTVAFYVGIVILFFGVVHAISACRHFFQWNREGRPQEGEEKQGLFSDWNTGERSPVKLTLVLFLGVMVMLVLLFFSSL